MQLSPKNAILLAVTAVIVSTTLYLMTNPPSHPAAGKVISSGRADIRADFALMDTKGKEVESKDFEGKYALYFMGYTFCPDICPASLLVMSQAVQELGREDLVPVFISVDPARDTPDQLESYIQNFPGVVALTGSKDQVDAAAKHFRVTYRKSTATENDEDYLVDHTSLIYLMDKNGEYLAHFPHTATVEELRNGIERALEGEAK
jgi:protein SCO1